MSPQEAIESIRGYAAAGRIIVTRHAYERMRQRNVTFRDVTLALSAARICDAANTNWRVTGPDVDGDELTLVVAIESGVIVVTVF